jgi:pre-mRNA-splicing factor ATP-dependent RNA helicase DHX15/PRP43
MSVSIRPDGVLDPKGKYLNPLTGLPYSKQYFYHSAKWGEYPPLTNAKDILRKIHKYSILLVVLPTGVGKTVILPKLLLHYFGYQKNVLVTTPRHATTSGAAEFAAKCMDVPIFKVDDIGKDIINTDIKGKKENRYPTGYRIVGYKYGGVNLSDYTTKLLFATDGLVKQMILGDDPNLSAYGGIVIDEAHERSVNIDILMSLVMSIIKRRPDFKVIIMSATIDKTIFTDYFKRINEGNNYSIYEIPNQPTSYHIDFQKVLKKIDQQKLTDIIYNKINDIIMDPKLPIGDILAFVTSEPDTSKVKRLIEKNMGKYPINNKPFPIAFTAVTPLSDQQIAKDKDSLKSIYPTADAPQGYARKVIIATNAVESSVTFGDPLVYVIESGLAFEKKYNAKEYCFITGKNYVSQASILQRCGRTGRNNAGYCFQLYTTDQWDKLQKYTTAKILIEDFTKELLGLILLPQNGNLQNALKFINNMIEPVNHYQDYINVAYKNLTNMDMIDQSGDITPLGYVCYQFSKYDLKIAKMIVGGYYLGCMHLTMYLGAILSVIQSIEDLFVKPPNMDEDPSLEAQYIGNIKRFVNENGDHMTLLIIFYNFITSPDPYGYAKQNGLYYNTLSKIQEAYEEILKIVSKLQVQIKNLNLFDVPPQVLLFGGSLTKSSKKNTSISEYNSNSSSFTKMSEHEQDFLNKLTDSNTEHSTDSDDSYDSDSISSISDSNGECEESEYISPITKYYNELKLFGNIKNTSIPTPIYNDEQNRTNPPYDLQNYNQNITYTNRNSGNDRTPNTTDISGTLYNSNQTQSNISGHSCENEYSKRKINRKINRKTRLKRTIHSYKLTIKNIEYPNVMVGGESDEDKKTKRREKILDLVTLKNLKNKTLIPPQNGFDQIMAALFYGYSTNIACYSGSGKKYTVKYSPNKGSIAKSSFDVNYINKTPDFVIYHEFIINRGMGREDAKLSIVSELRTSAIGQFLDLNELKKQL